MLCFGFSVFLIMNILLGILSLSLVYSSQLLENLSIITDEVSTITEKDLFNFLNEDISNLLILFYNQEDLLSPNTLRNFTKAAHILKSENPSMKFAKLDTQFAKKSKRRLLIQSIPCAIYITPTHFYQFTKTLSPDSLSSFISTEEYKSTQPYTIPKSLTISQILLKVLKEGVQDQWTLILNIFFILSVVLGLVLYCIYYCLSKETKPKLA